jgi:hypothetical protein
MAHLPYLTSHTEYLSTVIAFACVPANTQRQFKFSCMKLTKKMKNEIYEIHFIYFIYVTYNILYIMINIMNPPKHNYTKRPCKLNFNMFISKQYKTNKIIDDFKSPKLNRSKQRKKVTFSPSAKKHDGMCKHNEILNKHMYEISEGWSRNCILQQMINSKNLSDIKILYDDIMGLISRCKNSESDYVPIISSGAGKSQYITKLKHLEPLIKHSNGVLLILDKLKEANPSL